MTENQSLFFWIWKFESISTLRELRSKSYDCYAFIKAQKDVKTKYVLGMEATNWIREIWNMCHCFWHYESVPIFTYPWNNKLYKSDKKKGWINKLWRENKVCTRYGSYKLNQRNMKYVPLFLALWECTYLHIPLE